MYTINLTQFDDIQRSNAFGMPDNWKLKSGLRLTVNLKNGKRGTLALKDEYKPGCWHAEWEYDGSPLQGRIFEPGKQGFSDIMPMLGSGMPANTTWTTIIRLTA